MNDAERADAILTSSLLGAGRCFFLLSAGLTVAASFVLMSGGPASNIAVVATGVVVLYFSFRVEIDARLFWDAVQQRLSADVIDASLDRLGLRGSAEAGRTWQQRCRGARRLLLLQAVATAVQLVGVLVFAIVR